MPYLSRRILVSPCPLVNLDLFKKGHYHLSCRLVDEQAEQLYSKTSCERIMDLFGPLLSDYSFPGAHILAGERFITQTVLVEYTDQNFLLGECCVFQSDMPIRGDYTDAYVPSNLTLYVDLMYSGDDEIPEDAAGFQKVATRTVALKIDWRKGLHDHFPVVFDFFHMAAVGITVHASLHSICLDDYAVERPPVPGRRWPFQSQPTALEFSDLPKILFGDSSPLSENGEVENGSSSADGDRRLRYEVPTAKIQRAQDAYQMLCDLLRSARDSLHISHRIMSGERTLTDPSPDIGDLRTATSTKEVEEMCVKEISKLNVNLASTWEWFCTSTIVHPAVIQFLSQRTHMSKLAFMKETVISQEHADFRSIANITDPICQAVVATKLRRTVHIPYSLYCRENVESQSTCSVFFVEPCPWETLTEGATPPCPRQSRGAQPSPFRSIASGSFSFLSSVHPYFINQLPQSDRMRRPGIHLVICMHGLQGNQFDLRLYRVYLQLALPQLRLEFLMAQSNQIDTFCDFNVMTDRIVHEVREFIDDMPTPPSKISFIGHSLGNIVIRSLLTRPEFARFQPKLHLFLSICGPHLGTKFQTGIVSMGMWAVRKWFSSKSLLQLSLKDAPNPRDSFLYHLSESPSFEYFRHVVLLCSPQDKYVPYHSAKVATGSSDSSLQDNIVLEMIQNIVEPMRQAKVNLVRVSVDHSIPTSANSVIGRAAHIAMLDSELFIEKFVVLHLSQYFICA